MKLTVASYNLWFHKAYDEVLPIVAGHAVAIFCLQECSAEQLDQELGSLKLAGVASLGPIAQGTYYDPAQVKLLDVKQLSLPPARYEKQQADSMERLLACRFKDLATNRPIVVGNIHLANLLATNAIRRTQFAEALREIQEYAEGAPVVIMGDYNYPLPPGGLQAVARKGGFIELSQHNRQTTYRLGVFRGKFDRAFATDNIKEFSYEVLPFGKSDHAPILTTVHF